jgi:hypothetical protein
MSASIFVSHSSEDGDLAEALVDFLRLACSIDENTIFCSSVEGMNTSNGDDWITDILGNMITAKLFICLLTPKYMKSAFCCAEAGVAQVRKKTVKELSECLFTLVVPPMQYSDIGGILYGKQSADITDSVKFAELHSRVNSVIGRNSKTQSWEREYKKFSTKTQAAIAKRVVQKTINQQVVVVNVHSHTPTTGEVYRNKLRIIMRNDTGKEIKVKQLRWVADDPKQAGLHEVGDAKKAPQPWSVLMNVDKNGNWLSPELNSIMFPNKHLTVPGSQKFLASVALLPTLSNEGLEFLRLNDMLGTLRLNVVLDGVEYLVGKRI